MIILDRQDVERLLGMRACIDAVEEGFRALADPDRAQAGVLGLHVPGGGFHLKAATLRDNSGSWFAAKLNANFPGNPRDHGLPTIQGVLALFDASVGAPLAVMDSAALTIIRTAAATGVAARHLARHDASVLAVIGCGAQAAAQVEAVRCVRDIREIRLFDHHSYAARSLAERIGDATVASTIGDATLGADIIVTCTPSRTAFLRREHVSPGAFIAAVGADNEDKCEIDPSLMRDASLFCDVLSQCERIGDLHHAIEAGAVQRSAIRGELADVVLGRAHRTSAQEIIVFDSTGVAIEDVVAARLVYQAAGLSIS